MDDGDDDADDAVGDDVPIMMLPKATCSARRMSKLTAPGRSACPALSKMTLGRETR